MWCKFPFAPAAAAGWQVLWCYGLATVPESVKYKCDHCAGVIFCMVSPSGDARREMTGRGSIKIAVENCSVQRPEHSSPETAPQWPPARNGGAPVEEKSRWGGPPEMWARRGRCAASRWTSSSAVYEKWWCWQGSGGAGVLRLSDRKYTYLTLNYLVSLLL